MTLVDRYEQILHTRTERLQCPTSNEQFELSDKSEKTPLDGKQSIVYLHHALRLVPIQSMVLVFRNLSFRGVLLVGFLKPQPPMLPRWSLVIHDVRIPSAVEKYKGGTETNSPRQL